MTNYFDKYLETEPIDTEEEEKDRENYFDKYITEDIKVDSSPALPEAGTYTQDDIVENDELDITLEEINYLKNEYEIEEADSTEVV